MRWACRMDKVQIRQSVQEKGLIGNHTGGSRSMVGQGSVCRLAALKLVEQTKSEAAQELGVEPSQVEYAHGEFRSKESKKTVTLFDLAKKKPLSAMAEATVGSTFPNGCHIAEVEIDPETGIAARGRLSCGGRRRQRRQPHGGRGTGARRRDAGRGPGLLRER